MLIFTLSICRIKQTSLQALVNEQDKLVKNCIAQLVGSVAKHEFPTSEWVELLQFINTLCSSDNTADKEVRKYVFRNNVQYACIEQLYFCCQVIFYL